MMDQAMSERAIEATCYTQRTISHDEAREIAGRLINSHFRQEPHARVGIPARPDYDDDLLIVAYIRQQERTALAAAQRVAGPTPAEIELMMVDTEHHRAGPVYRCDDGTLRVYYAGFNLTALSEHIARELAQAAIVLSPGKVSEEL